MCNEGNKQDINIKNNRGEEQEELTLESVATEYLSKKGPFKLGLTM